MSAQRHLREVQILLTVILLVLLRWEGLIYLPVLVIGVMLVTIAFGLLHRLPDPH